MSAYATSAAARAWSIIIAISAFALLSTGVFAQESPEEAPVIELPDPLITAERSLFLGDDTPGAAQAVPASSTFGILRMILTLALSAAAIYGIVFLIKKAARGGRTQDPFLKVLASAPLGTNRAAHIVAVGSKAWLVGAAENGVNLISEIEDKDILNAMLLEDSRKSSESPAEGRASNGRLPDFKALLRRLGMPVEGGAPTPESIRERREKLKGL